MKLNNTWISINYDWFKTFGSLFACTNALLNVWFYFESALQEQYFFVYNALLEALKSGNTVISCSEFRSVYEALCRVDDKTGKSRLQEQFEASQKQHKLFKLQFWWTFHFMHADTEWNLYIAKVMVIVSRPDYILCLVFEHNVN